MAHYAGGLHNSMQGVCTVLCRTSAQAYAGCLHRHLPFEFVQLVHLYAADIAIDVNHDGNGHGRFGCRDGNGEQGEEVTFQSAGKQETVNTAKLMSVAFSINSIEISIANVLRRVKNP